MTSHSFTLVFISALVAASIARFWLAWRQIRFVARHREQVPAAFADKISADEHRRAADYTCAKTRLNSWSDLADSAVALALTLGGGLKAIDWFWRGIVDGQLAQGILLIGSAALLISLFEMPFELYKTFSIEARFGFNKITPRLFLQDLAKQTLLALFLGLPLVAVVLLLMQQAGEKWWLYAWGVWVGFNLFVLAVYPTFIAPIFNKFSPLDEGAVKRQIEALLEKCGFKAQGLFVMDGSKRSSHGNAYFTGFGKTKRIVFFDTLLARLEPSEIEAVLAHELGHFKRRHVLKRMLLSFAFSLGLLALLGFLLDKDWFYSGLNAGSPSPAMALLLFFLTIPAFTFLLKPLFSFFSRKNEFEADDYAAAMASGTSLIHALVKLYQDNAATLTPDPLYSAWHDSHPPAAVRIANLQQSIHNSA